MERIGVVERVVPSAELQPVLNDLAATIAANGPLAIRGAKRIVRVRMEPGLKAARELSDALRNAFEWTKDADEGIAAHLENRLPQFSGC
jgi:enoyl-CoA hydratase/carnithine racemase